MSNEVIHKFVIEEIIKPVLPAELDKGDITYHINPTGRFVIGGPHGDCGLTGRKIIVDTYGGWGRHGGGAFSGKDPTKVDRSAAYMARHVAKNIVEADLAERCEVQLAYAIGVAEPVSVHVDTQGTGRIDDARLCELIREHFELTPRGIIDYLKLRRPIYQQTAAGGTFWTQRSGFDLGKYGACGRIGRSRRLGSSDGRITSAIYGERAWMHVEWPPEDRSLTEHPARSFELAQFARTWWTALSLSGGFLLLAFAALMLARRFQGGLTTPLTPAELVGVGALLAFLAAVMHRGVQVCWRGKTVWFWVVQSLPFVGLASSAAAVSLPGSSPYGICAMVALLAMEEGYWLRGVIRRDKRLPGKVWRRPQVRTRPLSLENDPFSNSDSQGLPEGVSHRNRAYPR